MSKVIETSNALPLSPASESGFGQDLLTEVLRKGTRELLPQAVEQKVHEWLAERTGLTDERGRQGVVRNGHLPERTILTGIHEDDWLFNPTIGHQERHEVAIVRQGEIALLDQPQPPINASGNLFRLSLAFCLTRFLELPLPHSERQMETVAAFFHPKHDVTSRVDCRLNVNRRSCHANAISAPKIPMRMKKGLRVVCPRSFHQQ